MARSSNAIVALGLVLLAAWGLFSSRSEVDFVGMSKSKPSERQKVCLQGVDKAMKERIASVEKTGKLTDAMRLVAAAKVRRAQDGVTKSRPFSMELQSMIKGLVKKLAGTGLEAELPMLRVPEKINNVGILIITANRGLCGAYNTFVLKKTAQRVADLNAQGIVPKLVIVGRKGRAALTTKLAKVEVNYTEQFFGMPDTLSSKVSSEVSDAVRNLFLSGEVDKVEVVYSKFINLLTNEPKLRTLLPLSPTGIEDPEDETFKLTTTDGKMSVEKDKAKAAKAKEIEPDVIFDQPPEVILNSMLPLYLNSQILSILYDGQASELSSRMVAMKTATDNAVDLKAKLLLLYNKKRQAQITAEVCEISAGASAFDDMGDGSGGPALGLFDNEETAASDFLEEIKSGKIPDEPQMPDGPADKDELKKLNLAPGFD